MLLEFILNERAFESQAANEYEARQRMERFIQTLAQATKKGFARVLRLKQDLYSIELAPSYNLAQWLVDPKVDKEAKRFLHSLTTKQPFWKDLPQDDVSEYLGCEHRHNEQVVEGLGLAALLDAFGASLLTEDCWDAPLLTLQRSSLEDEAVVDVEVRHLSQPEHITEHQEWIEESRMVQLTSGVDLWERRVELFPHLRFCEIVESQLSGLHNNNVILPSVFKKLRELQRYSQSWVDGPFGGATAIGGARPDSDATLSQFAAERTVVSAEFGESLYSWHINLYPNKWRLYFRHEVGPNLLLIGYIGPHLRTVSNN